MTYRSHERQTFAGQDFRHRTLDGTFYKFCDFQGATFRGASLRGVSFGGCNLRDVDSATQILPMPRSGG